MSQPPNLTRDQASERSATVTTSSYDITIDLTDGPGGPGEKTFRTDDRHRVRRRSPGRAPSSTSSVTGSRTATLNGRELDVGSWTTAGGLPLDDLAADNELIGRRGRALHQHRRGSAPVRRPGRRCRLPVLPVRDRRREEAFRLLRPAGPEGQIHRDGHRTGRLAGGVQRRDNGHRARPGRCAGAPLRDHRTDEHLRHRPGRRPVPRGSRSPRRHRPGHLLPASPGPAPRRRAAVHRDEAGLRLLPRRVRGPVPVRQVRPAVRPGVQRRRHGERRRGDLPRGVRLPLPGDPLPLRAALRDASCTRWPTCGSATWSPCAGGTTCG